MILKNTWNYKTKDDNPDDIPQLIPSKRNENFITHNTNPINRMYLICTFGLGIKNTAGIADSKKRKHENNRGGKSF